MQIYKILTQKYTLKKIKPDFCGHNGNPLENKIIQKQVDLEGKKNHQLFSFFLALSNSKHNTGGRRTSVICGCGLLLPRPPPSMLRWTHRSDLHPKNKSSKTFSKEVSA